MPGEQGPVLSQVCGFDNQFIVIGPEMIRHESSIRKFAVLRMIEANRKGFDLVAGQLAHNACDDAGVHPAAEHGTDGNIGHHALFNGAVNVLLDTLNVLLDRALFGSAKGVVPVALLMKRILLDEEPVAGENLINVRKKCGRCGDITNAQEIGEGLYVGLALYSWMAQQ